MLGVTFALLLLGAATDDDPWAPLDDDDTAWRHWNGYYPEINIPTPEPEPDVTDEAQAAALLDLEEFQGLRSEGFVPAIAQVRCSIWNLLSSSLAECTTLDLRSNALHSMPTWENVTFSDNLTFAMLSEALWDKERMPRIHTLLLSDSKLLAEDEARFLGTIAPRLFGLTTLALDGCNLTATTAEAVVNSTLVAGSPLRTLTLARNELGADGAKAIARQLAHSDQLSMLQLSDTNLGEEGGKILAEALGNGAGAGLGKDQRLKSGPCQPLLLLQAMRLRPSLCCR